MQNADTLTPRELDAIIRSIPPDEDGPFIAPKKWARVDVGNLETYIGDKLYVVTLVEKLPETIDELEANNESAEKIVIRYLQNEGFIDEEYAYVGMQQLDLRKPPLGLV